MIQLFPTLETERLRLRMLTRDDADALFHHFADANVTRYMGIDAFTNVQEVWEMIDFFIELSAQRNGTRWAIIRKEDEAFLGTCGFYFWDKESQRCEIGYDLAPAAWGQGYMHEAVTAMIEYLFNELDLHRLEAMTDPVNPRSQNLLLRLGFRLEGVLRDHDKVKGVFLDDLVFGLLRPEWRAVQDGRAPTAHRAGRLISHRAVDALQVVGVRYRGSTPAVGDERCLDAYAAAGVYDAIGAPVHVSEPTLPEGQRNEVATDNLGILGGAIADAVADARRRGDAILMTGGDCSHITGIVGGLQDAHGPRTRIGLVWFDAHGDFNTPQTTLSGMLGGMPVAVCAGLAFPRWRALSHIAAPLPADRIVMVDVRNLDPAEETLIRAVGIPVAAPAPGFPGIDLVDAVSDLADRCDMLYLHIDSDILDEAFVPNHGTKEPNGPNLEQVLAAVDTVMATGKVAVLAVVSVYGEGEGSARSVASGLELIRGSLAAWSIHGMA